MDANDLAVTQMMYHRHMAGCCHACGETPEDCRCTYIKSAGTTVTGLSHVLSEEEAEIMKSRRYVPYRSLDLD